MEALCEADFVLYILFRLELVEQSDLRRLDCGF